MGEVGVSCGDAGASWYELPSSRIQRAGGGAGVAASGCRALALVLVSDVRRVWLWLRGSRGRSGACECVWSISRLSSGSGAGSVTLFQHFSTLVGGPVNRCFAHSSDGPAPGTNFPCQIWLRVRPSYGRADYTATSARVVFKSPPRSPVKRVKIGRDTRPALLVNLLMRASISRRRGQAGPVLPFGDREPEPK